MAKSKIGVLFFLLIIAASAVLAFQTNSTNYRNSPVVVSYGGDIIDSGSYKNYIASGVISGVTDSGSYKNSLGFFHVWRLANGQLCTLNNQCESNACCSNVCRSSCPSDATGGGGGGGVEAGGGGGAIIPIQQEIDFGVSPSSIKAKLALGEEEEKSIIISNTGASTVSIPLKLEAITKYASLSQSSVSLEPGQSTKITLNILAKDVGAFVGELTAKAGGVEKSIPIILEFISKLILFDVKLDIPEQYAEVEPGQELKVQMTILNVGAPEKVDVFATYFIKDLRSNIIYEETETFAVEKQISYQKSFNIHDSTEPGSYVAIAEIKYAGSFAVSSQIFRVVEKKEKSILDSIARNTSLMLFSGLLIIIAVSLLAYKLVSINIKAKRKGKRRR